MSTQSQYPDEALNAFVLMSHPAVNAYTRNMALALVEGGLLDSLYTTLAWDESKLNSKLLPEKLLAELRRRKVDSSVMASVHRHPWRESARLVAGRLGLHSFTKHESGRLSVDAIYQDLDQFVARRLTRQPSKRLRAVYAGEDGALATFRSAEKLGLQRFYDLPIGYWKEAQRIYKEEREAFPEFASTLTGLDDSPAKLERKEEEMGLASVIFACSPFVKDSLTRHGVQASRIEVVPYGSPESFEPPRTWGRSDSRRPLRVLFAGSLGQRKGIGYLLEAIKRLNRKDVELVLMGRFSGNPDPVLRFRDWFRLEASRPHHAVLQLMRECDVLILPSLLEGLAMVVPEAMSCGLPVIITRSTGAEFLVRDGKEGFIIGERSITDIEEKISWFADHRDELTRMGQSAARRVGEHSWRSYRQLFMHAVGSRLKNSEDSASQNIAARNRG